MNSIWIHKSKTKFSDPIGQYSNHIFLGMTNENAICLISHVYPDTTYTQIYAELINSN